MSPPANDDALLRWNSCARMIMAYADIEPAEDEREVAASEVFGIVGFHSAPASSLKETARGSDVLFGL